MGRVPGGNSYTPASDPPPTAWMGPGSFPRGTTMPPSNSSTRYSPLAAASVISARRVPAISSPIPANPAVARTTSTRNVITSPRGCHPNRTAAIHRTTIWSSSTTKMAAPLASRRAGRPSGVVPRRLSTPYCRSNPVAIPRLTIPVDMTARARTPGARKAMVLTPPVNDRSGYPMRSKNPSSTIGIPSVSRSDSPRRRVIVTSALVCALSARLDHNGFRRAGDTAVIGPGPSETPDPAPAPPCWHPSAA